jgi:flagellar assembly factor FliW
MHIESTRFGTFEVLDDLVLTFPNGLIGLPGQRYVLVAKDEGSPFFWLHSAEHADVAVPVTNPWLFFSDYEVRVSDDDAELLQLTTPEDADIYCVVRASSQLAECTVNLAAPVLIHRVRRSGRQIINDAGGYSVRHHLFSEVELNEARAMAAESEKPAEATAV